jgi:hypothetical protein
MAQSAYDVFSRFVAFERLKPNSDQSRFLVMETAKLRATLLCTDLCGFWIKTMEKTKWGLSFIHAPSRKQTLNRVSICGNSHARRDTICVLLSTGPQLDTSTLFGSYLWSVDEEWLVSAWSDGSGAILRTFVVPFGQCAYQGTNQPKEGNAKFAIQTIWDQAREMQPTAVAHVVVARLGKMSAGTYLKNNGTRSKR